MHEMLTYFQSAVEETGGSRDGQWGEVENIGMSAQGEGLRRFCKVVTLMPRPQRSEGANHENSGGRKSLFRGIACAKFLWW